jgi:hypothetical protein
MCNKQGRARTLNQYCSRSSTKKNIIIIYVYLIQFYNPECIRNGFSSIAEIVCPCCKDAGHLVYHATYEKYYYGVRIMIIRVLCTHCGITHAIIPSFSLPGTSIGTEEAENYLEDRAHGASRMKAGKHFFRARDVHGISDFF